MTTVRQIERLWAAKQFPRLFNELVAARPEATICVGVPTNAPAAAAIAIIRLNELNQDHVPLYSQLVRILVAAQEADGGWGDLMLTALCLRALLCGNGQGLAIERGLTFLAGMQKPQGIWPKIPIRRTAEDAYTSAFVLYQLGDQPAFQAAARVDDAVAWFEQNLSTLDVESRRLWERARLRCRTRHPVARSLALTTANWS